MIAVDLALGMLLADRERRPPAIVGDAVALPFAPGGFDVVLAPFCLNHLAEPSAGVAEAARVLRPGRGAAGLDVRRRRRPRGEGRGRSGAERGRVGAAGWYGEVKAAMASWGTVDAAAAAIERGGMAPLLVERREVAFPELAPLDLVAWRLGMAHTAPFVAGLDQPRRDELVRRALELLGPDPAPLVRRVIFLAAA